MISEKEVVIKLQNYGRLNFLLEIKNRQLTDIIKQKYELCSPSATILSSMPKSKKINDDTFNKVIKITEEYENEISRLSASIKDLLLQKDEIEKNIAQLLPFEQHFITLRYFEKKKWFQIEQILNYSQRQPFNINKKIIKQLSVNWISM